MYEYSGVVTKVVDGDTIDIRVDLGFGISNNIRVRFKGIDTPEIYRPSCNEELIHGRQARQFVFDSVMGRKITFVTHKDRKGKYGRYLADIAYTEDGELKLLTEELIKNGFEKKDYES